MAAAAWTWVRPGDRRACGREPLRQAARPESRSRVGVSCRKSVLVGFCLDGAWQVRARSPLRVAGPARLPPGLALSAASRVELCVFLTPAARSPT